MNAAPRTDPRMDPLMDPPTDPLIVPLQRDGFGRLMLRDAAGTDEIVTPVRAFPLTAPMRGLSLVGRDGRERLWIDDLDAIDEAARALIDQALAPRDFAPQLLKLHKVSSYGVPSTWTVSTDRGDLDFVLKAEEDIRRLGGGSLLIASASGLQLRVPDPKALDRASRKMLERFL